MFWFGSGAVWGLNIISMIVRTFEIDKHRHLDIDTGIGERERERVFSRTTP